VVESGDGSGTDGRDRQSGALLLMQTQNIFDAAEVSQHANARPAVLAEGFDDAVIAAAVRLIGLEGGPSITYIHITSWTCQLLNLVWF